MPRAIAGVFIGHGLVLAATFGLGLLSPVWPVLRGRHIALALFALLLACLIQVIGFTYLTVTGKVIAQAVHLAGLPLSCLQRGKTLKKAFTRLLALVVLTCVLAAATGARRWRIQYDVPLHLLSSLLVLAAQALALGRQYSLIMENARLLNEVLAQYADRRAGKGGDLSASSKPASTETPSPGFHVTAR